MAGSGSVGTVSIPIVSGLGTTSTSWASHSHPPYTSSHVFPRCGMACPACLVVGSIQGRDGRVRVGRDGLHPHRFRVGNHIDAMGPHLPPPHTHPSTGSPGMPHSTRGDSCLVVSRDEMAESGSVGMVSIPTVSRLGPARLPGRPRAGNAVGQRSSHPGFTWTHILRTWHSAPIIRHREQHSGRRRQGQNRRERSPSPLYPVAQLGRGEWKLRAKFLAPSGTNLPGIMHAYGRNSRTWKLETLANTPVICSRQGRMDLGRVPEEQKWSVLELRCGQKRRDGVVGVFAHSIHTAPSHQPPIQTPVTQSNVQRVLPQ